MYEHILIFYERRLDHESILSRSGLWAKILGEEPLFSCLGLSFEDRFGNVCTRVAGAIAPAAGGRRRSCVFTVSRPRASPPAGTQARR